MFPVSDKWIDPTHETSEPDRYWSTVNGREATPLVMTALDWTFWKKSLELAAMRAWSDLGIVAFHGRQALMCVGRHGLHDSLD